MTKLSSYLNEYFNWYLNGSAARDCLDEYDLARKLEQKGYCTTPFFEIDKALTCPINKRREKDCAVASCSCNDFCRRLRKEGYI